MNIKVGYTANFVWDVFGRDSTEGNAFLTFTFIPKASGDKSLAIGELDLQKITFVREDLYANRAVLSYQGSHWYGFSLSNITKADEGQYRCQYYGQTGDQNQTDTNHIQLIVTGKI